jgi:MFS family permease
VLASSISSITAALAGPVLGRIVDRQGPRLVLIGSVVLMGIALGGCAFVGVPWQFYLAFGLMSGMARSALQSVLPGAMIANWFVRRRGAAYGSAAMGPPVANFVLPPLIALIVGTLGWRDGWLALGLICIALALPPALFIVRRRPEDLGLRADGDEPEPATEDSDQPKREAVPSQGEDWTAREAVHSPAFWMVAAGMSCILLAPNVSIVFMYSYLSSKGMDLATAATAISAVSAMQVISRLVFWAPVIGRVKSVRRIVLFWGGIMLCATLLLALAEGQTWAFVAAAVLGLGLGGNLVLQLQIWPEYFGRTEIGSIIGTSQLLQGLSSATVPLLLAALLDHTGNYTMLYLIVAGLVVIGLILHAIVGRPKRPAAAHPLPSSG